MSTDRLPRELSSSIAASLLACLALVACKSSEHLIGAEGDFTLTASPVGVSTAHDQSATATISVLGENSFVGSVALSVTGLPVGASAQLVKDTVAAGGSTQLLLSSGIASAGTHAVEISGINGALTRTASLNWTITNTCAADIDCGLGSLCVNHACAPGCSETHGCAGRLACCSGACIDTESNLANCGACNSACSSTNIATPVCSGGKCAGACNPGTADCNGDKRSDGCETNTTVEGNCGGCGVSCVTNECAIGLCKVTSGQGACVSVDRSGCATPSCALPDAGCGWKDSDGDGLSDAWERNGYIDMNCNGVNDEGDIQLPGADPSVRDIYVRYDYMATATHTHQPPAAALEQVAQAFAAHQINLHWLAPAGPLPGPDGGVSEYDVVTLDDAATAACAGQSFITMSTLRHESLCNPDAGGYPCAAGDHQPAIHYLVFGHDSTTPNSGVHAASCPVDSLCGGRPSAGSTGNADVGGDDVIISFGAFVDSSTPIGIELWAATIMHELGHNLTLVHGSLADPGNANQTCLVNKPNYVSVMNYAYQLGPIIPAATAGDTSVIDCNTDADCGPPLLSSGRCAVANACHCTDDLVPYGGNVCYRVDYSDTRYIPLNEASLNEEIGVGGPIGERDIILFFDSTGNEYLGPSNGAPIDWNISVAIEDAGVSADIDHNGTMSDLLNTSTDWDKLDFAFQCLPGYGAGTAGGASLSEPAERHAGLRREQWRALREADLAHSVSVH